MAASSIPRGVAATAALRRRCSLLQTVDGAPLLSLPRGLHHSATALPPAVTSAHQRHLSTTGDAIMASPRETRMATEQAEKAKADLLRHLLLEDATDRSKIGGDKMYKTEQLEEYLRGQIKLDADGAPVMAAGDADKQLLLALLVRWTQAEEKLRANTAKLEGLEKNMKVPLMLTELMAKTMFVYLTLSAGALFVISK